MIYRHLQIGYVKICHAIICTSVPFLVFSFKNKIIRGKYIRVRLADLKKMSCMFVCLFSFHWLPKPRLNIIDGKSYQIYLQQKALLMFIVVQTCTQSKPFQNKHHNILKISIKLDLRNSIILPLGLLLSKYKLCSRI